MIQVNELTKYFGPTRALDSISFHVKRGEIVGFLGPNGAGKTTTLRILTCYIPASAGTASIQGHDVFTDSMAVRRIVGYLPESCPLYPEMRVNEYLQFRARIRGLPPGERSAAIGRVVERCWVREFVTRPIGHLSKGMKQRVGLADALLHNPPVLILDEPTIGLDPAQIRETRKLIGELAHDHTVVLSTHILPEVEAICSRSIIIARGRIVASGSPAELRERLTGRLIAEIKGRTQDVKSALAALDGVRHVDATEENGWNRLVIETKGERDLREDVFRLAVAKEWPLREVKLESGSLEEFFVRIVAEQAQVQNV
jgi:ABC-2 type transport system ATP-binding protein